MRIIFVLVFIFCIIFCKAQDIRTPGKKTSPHLEQFSKLKKKPDSVDVVLSFKDVSAISNWGKKIRIIYNYLPSNTIVCRVKADFLMQLINDTTVIFADLHRRPKEELASADFDITLNKLNVVHRLYPSINGSNIYASLKEQRFDTADIDLKGRYFNTGIAAPALTGHASRMVTMLAGGGNTAPFTKGAAPGVHITSSDFSNLLPDADAIYQQNNISVQNHSYGTDIENYYGADAAAFDASTFNNPSLIHVFSSGNIGTTTSATGPYSGVSQMANLSGSFKMAKNIITVGAVDSLHTIMELSSKGPAYDGRVKPDLVAFGQDGSSGSSALVSGAAALVQDAMKQHENVVNAAKEAGVQHIVYTSFSRKKEDETSAISIVTQSHIKTENLIKASGIPYTILRNGIYADMLPIFLGEKVLETGVYFSAGDGKVSFTTRHDMAEAAAHILTSEGHEGKEYEVANTENISFQDVADILSGITGKKVTYLNPNADEYKTALTQAGVPAEYIGMFAAFAEAMKQGEFETDRTDLPQLLGRKPTPVTQYLKQLYSSYIPSLS